MLGSIKLIHVNCRMLPLYCKLIVTGSPYPALRFSTELGCFVLVEAFLLCYDELLLNDTGNNGKLIWSLQESWLCLFHHSASVPIL